MATVQIPDVVYCTDFAEEMQLDSMTFAVVLASAIALGVRAAATRRRISHDSISEQIDFEAARMLADRLRSQSRDRDRDYPQRNELDADDEFRDRPAPRIVLHTLPDTVYDYDRSDHIILPNITRFNQKDILKSGKRAMIVTEKELLKREWCKTEPFKQRIRENHCTSYPIINFFCYGQCSSFYIPKGLKRRRNSGIERDDEDQNISAFKSCSFCKPKKYAWVTITLHCPSLTPSIKRKRIQTVKQCKCSAVEV